MRSIRNKRKLIHICRVFISYCFCLPTDRLCGRILRNLCGRLSRELSIVETSGLNHFVAPVTLQMTYISELIFCACKSAECRIFKPFFLPNICRRLSRELSIVETSGKNHFVAPVTLQITYISDLTFWARKSAEGRIYKYVLWPFFTQYLREIISRTKHHRGFWFEPDL